MLMTGLLVWWVFAFLGSITFNPILFAAFIAIIFTKSMLLKNVWVDKVTKKKSNKK